jgi:hypothetical protein
MHSNLRHYMEMSGQLHTHASLPVGEEPHCTYWIGNCLGPTAHLHMVFYCLSQQEK